MITLLKKRLGSDESGFALMIVIAIGLVLMILASVAVSFSVTTSQKSKVDNDAAAALSAAYAGIEEYQSRLANDSSYFQYGDSTAAFSAGSTLTLPTGTQANPAFGTTATGSKNGWAKISSADGNAGSFRYEVNTANYFSNGVIRVRATGKYGTATKSIIADLKQTGFIDFLYFTDYEIQDPQISGASATCVKYAWAGRSTSCQGIQFGPSDLIKGPMHSNDTMQICGTTFTGIVTTGNNTPSGGRLYTIPSGCSDGTFPAGSGKVTYSPVVGMPSTNALLKKETRADLPSDVPRPGCLYTGPTTITYLSNGQVTVRSPWTKFTNTKNDDSSVGVANANCGTAGAGAGALGSATGATFTPSTKTVFYVQNVPTLTADVNYSASAPTGAGYSCKGVDGGVGNGLGYPMHLEAAPSTTAYGCTNGDVFVKGTLSGQMTVAADNYIYVVGDLKYNDSSADMLGLIGNNAIWVWNPVDSQAKNSGGTYTGNDLLTDSARRIDAAMLSLNHTFQVQNYQIDSGGRGILTVNGAIAQRYRGPVGTTGGTGYSKNYVYDARLKYTAPPKFLSPVTTTYGVTTWMDTAPAFNVDGSYK